MKKFKALAVGLLALSIGIGGANAATASKSIDASKCETVYTNYYFFLAANTKEYYSQRDLSTYSHNSIADFKNNIWNVNNFDLENIGYGEVNIGHGISTSKDGITSMSLADFYSYLKQGAYSADGIIRKGNNNYIVTHTWREIKSDNSIVQGNGSTNFKDQTVDALIDATLDVNNTITIWDSVEPNTRNIKLQIKRNLKGDLSGRPIKNGDKQSYVVPALYYIQYCSPKQAEPDKEFKVTYHENANNVTDMPNNQTYKENSCFTVGHAPSREGYTFLGWSANNNDSKGDSKYAPGKEICNLNRDLDLYAIWKKNEEPTVVTDTYKVIYNANTTDTVTGMPGNDEINIELDYTISSMVPVRPGYEFLGWNTDATADVGSDEFKGGSLYQNRKDLVLYAIWRKTTDENPKPSNPSNPENPKTGVADYLLPACGTVGLSGIGLQVLKKKKTFRQF